MPQAAMRLYSTDLKELTEVPSRKLEERLREIGVRKYLRLKKIATDDMSSAKVITV